MSKTHYHTLTILRFTIDIIKSITNFVDIYCQDNYKWLNPKNHIKTGYQPEFNLAFEQWFKHVPVWQFLKTK